MRTIRQSCGVQSCSTYLSTENWPWQILLQRNRNVWGSQRNVAVGNEIAELWHTTCVLRRTLPNCRLYRQEDDTLREHLASAIANCCSWGNNCYEFGRLGAVTPLVGYMMSKERRVHRTTALALCQLSQDPFNCVTLHSSGVVPVSIYRWMKEREYVTPVAVDVWGLGRSG